MAIKKHTISISKRAQVSTGKNMRGNSSQAKLIKGTKTKRQIKKNDEALKGGLHWHWLSHHDKKFTDLDGWHEHIFLIAGHLRKTDQGGIHRHPINSDDSVGPQLKPHDHDIFIDDKFFAVEPGGDHDSPPVDREFDVVPPEGTSHRHRVVIDNVTYTSLTADDVLSVEIRKSLHLGVQSILFNKERFMTFENAAAKAEELGFDLKKFEERSANFVFTQADANNFKEMSLQTIDIEDGVQAIIGVLIEADEHDDRTPVISDPDVSQSEEATQAEEAAFDDLQEKVTIGYMVLSEKEAEALKHLKDEFASKLKAIYEIVDKSIDSVVNYLNGEIEKSIENFTKAALMDRVTTLMVLMQEELGKIPFHEELKVEIDEELIKELSEENKESVCFALKTISDIAGPLEKLFADTSFENLHLLLKSTNLTFNRFIGQNDIEKNLHPTDEMTREELRESQDERSEKFGIEVVEGSALTFPAGFPEDLEEYGDPVNLKFPFDTIERARNARVRFKQFANQIYEIGKSKQIVHTRIVEKELEFGVSVTIDLGDPLDELLPASLRDEEGVTVIEKGTHQDGLRINKHIFVPIHKLVGEERIAFGIVLEPDVVDLHGDTYDQDAVKFAAHHFMENFQNIKLQHKEFVNDEVKILESFIAPTDMIIDTPMGPVEIKKNTWLMKVRIIADKIWKQVKSGEITGFSIGALATVEEL